MAPVSRAATTQPLEQALANARRSGRTLLVLVIPADNGRKHDRGAAFGELLNYGSDAQLAPLSACEVVCATMDDLRQLRPDAPAGEPLMVTIDDAASPAVRALDAKLPYAREVPRLDGSRWQERLATENSLAERRIATLAGLLAPLGRPGSTARQAEEVRARLVAHRIPGSHWANASGCGTDVEEDPEDEDGEREMIGCGMGHVPEKSARFLYLYAQTPAQERRAQKAKARR
jgi:hypothetical protein